VLCAQRARHGFRRPKKSAPAAPRAIRRAAIAAAQAGLWCRQISTVPRHEDERRTPAMPPSRCQPPDHGFAGFSQQIQILPGRCKNAAADRLYVRLSVSNRSSRPSAVSIDDQRLSGEGPLGGTGAPVLPIICHVVRRSWRTAFFLPRCQPRWVFYETSKGSLCAGLSSIVRRPWAAAAPQRALQRRYMQPASRTRG
jgi:hypothetical protein